MASFAVGIGESTTKGVLSNVWWSVRSKHKGPITSTDGQLRKFTYAAYVKLESIVKEHADHIAKGEIFVGSWAAVTAWSLPACLLRPESCVFYSLPTTELSGGFALGRMYKRGGDFMDPGAK
jgi:hypothetical protein